MRWVVAAMAVAVAGCGAELEDGQGGGYGPQAVTAPVLDLADGALDGGRDAGAEVTPEDFVGTWAHRYDQVGISELPALGPEPTTIIALSRVEITAVEITAGETAGETAGAVVLSSEVCAVIIERERDIVQTVVPPAFIDALPIAVRTATLEGDRLFAPWFSELRGVVLEDPDNDPLPTEPDDPRVVDLDRDGNPGLTVLSTGLIDGEIYIVQRSRSQLDGRLRDDTLDGSIEWAVEDAVLGADNPILAMAVPIEPDLEASAMRTTRIDAEVDCAAIVAGQATIFAR